MGNVIKVILALLAALVLFLTGWFAHAYKNRKEVEKQVKEAISDINKLHKDALNSLKKEYEEKLRKKDEIIRKLIEIIDRLLRQLEPLQGTGAYGVDSLICKLNTNKEKLRSI